MMVRYAHQVLKSLPISGKYKRNLPIWFGKTVWIKIVGNVQGIFLAQPNLTCTILKDNRFLTLSAATPMVAGLQLITAVANLVSVYQSKYLLLIGSLSYLAVGSQPDTAFEVNYLARFLSGPQQEHWTALKHLLQYLLLTHD